MSRFTELKNGIGRKLAVITRLTERTARVSLLLCTVMVAGSCISVSALSIQSRDNTVVADSMENVSPESITVSYEEFLDMTEEIEQTTDNPNERRHLLVEGAKGMREYTGEPYDPDANDESLSAEVIQNTAPKDLSDRQITRMLSGNAGTVRVIKNQDLNVQGSNSGQSTDMGNSTAQSSGSVSSSFDSSNNYVVGIDVSGWNGSINWTKVKAYGVQFVMVKCGGRYTGGGGLYTDSKFATNARGAAAVGIKVGVYFFSAAKTIQEAYEEASFTVNTIKGYNITYPVAIDYEKNSSSERHYGCSGKALRDVLCTFCDTVQSQGYSPMVYMSKSMWTNSSLGLGTYGSEVASKYKVWLAAYFTSSGKTVPFKIGDKLPSFSFRYHIWQYGFVDASPLGMSNDVDMNLGFFSSNTLLDPTVTVEGGYLYTTAGTVISATRGVTAMNSLGQTVSNDNLNVYIYKNGVKISMEAACQTPGVYNVYYIFGDAYRGQVEHMTRLLVADPSDGSIPGCTPTPAPASSAAATSAAATSAAATSAAATSEAAATSAAAPSETAPTSAETTPTAPSEPAQSSAEAADTDNGDQ